MSRPRLSLCMIVRDEESMLPDLIASVAGLWDEFVAVDTGSSDGTVGILEAAGARVVHRPWDDDFAAARNAGLEIVTGEWILSLDADERVSPELRDAVRDVLADDRAGAASVLLRDELPSGGRHETRLLRLFRNDPAIRYRHRIHEDVSEGIETYLARTGRRAVTLPGVLQHLGYSRDVAADRHKKERDLALLRRCVADAPDNWYSRYKILEQARFWEDEELLASAARDTDAALDDAPDDALAHCRFGGDLVALIAAGLDDGDAAELARLDAWRDRVPPAPELPLRRGVLLENLERTDEASAAYDEALANADRLAIPAARVRPLMGRCRLAMAAGRVVDARARVLEALADAPGDPEALLAAETLAKALLAGRDLDGARALAAAVMDHRPEAALGVLVCDLVAGRDLVLDVDIEPDAADAALRAWTETLWSSRDTDAMTGFLDRMGLVTDLFPWLPDHLRELTDDLKRA